ncbi:MAG: transglutaminase family protein [Chitinophagia bacterium]|nr:transglutaminase family protein [Chitinophagia bacterium]
MAIFSIHHITRYEYDRPIKESVNSIKMYPYQYPLQRILLHELSITGNPEVNTFTDYWGNKEGIFNVSEQHEELIIDSRLTIQTLPSGLPMAKTSLVAELPTFIQNDLHLLELARPSRIDGVEEMDAIIRSINPEKKDIFQIIQETSAYVFETFQYIKGITTIETTVDELLIKKAGVCQDFAHVMLEILRRIGIPGRYVSGYICPNKNGMRGEGATHAWVEAFIPGMGWMGIDPTNNTLANEHHIKLASGRDFTHCSPVKGIFKGPAHQSLSVYVSVGYEDGHRFEEMNKVQLELQKGSVEADKINNNFAAQQ